MRRFPRPTQSTKGQVRLFAIAAFAVLCLGVAGAGAAEGPDLAALNWIHPGVDPVDALTNVPAECTVKAGDADQAAAIRLGRVAFRSPVLLGGLAARIGLSCNSCHPNGNANLDFYIVGVSGAPGTVDVTGSVFSTNREDGQFNPVAIPSLVDVALRSNFGSRSPTGHLERFVRSVIVDEFQGQEPSPSIRDALLAYLSSLRRSACPAPASGPRTDFGRRFEADTRDLRDGLKSLLATLAHKDSDAALFALVSHRAALGRVYRRFPASVPIRGDLLELSRRLGGLRDELRRAPNSPQLRSAFESALRKQDVMIERLRERLKDSYYDPARLRDALARKRDSRE